MDILLVLVASAIILESFPVSSSGNMLVLMKILTSYGFIMPEEAVIKIFDYLVHGVTLCVLACFFYPRLMLLFVCLKRRPGTIIKLFLLGFIAETMTAVCYPLIIMAVDHRALLPVGFCITTALLYFSNAENFPARRTVFDVKNAAYLGLFQGFALVPGISRLAMTFTAGRWLGFSAEKSFALSFLIEAPISLAAFLKGSLDIYTHNYLHLLNLPFVLIMIVSGIAAYVSLGIVWDIIQKKQISILAYYTAAITVMSIFL